MGAQYPWMLVGPWYRWEEAGVPASGRDSSPVFHKYASTNFINEFLKEPQCSLKYKNEDFVHRVSPGGASKYSLSNLHYDITSTRKIFLTTHSRFYLVVCELHCDAAGFPSVSRENVCEAGFVIRRLTPRVLPLVEEQVANRLSQLDRLQGKVDTLEEKKQALENLAGARRSTVRAAFHRALNEGLEKKIAKVEAEATAVGSALQTLLGDYKIPLRREGWVPSTHKGIGSWQDVSSEEPQELREEVFPLYPLIPDPAVKCHTAQGRSIWFGILPTGSSDMDANGNPRFDDHGQYEVRCFVRRHVKTCPKKSTPRDCPGNLVWSRPTEPYQLASHFDLTGTSNRPVTIQLPDLDSLKAQVDALRSGQGTGVRMASSANSFLRFDTDRGNVSSPRNAGLGGPAICSFAIPLITIVATFVLRLFLPVVVFLFQLWFLLRLRFCIPPLLSIDAGLTETLNTDLSMGVDVGTDIQTRLVAGESIWIDNTAITSVEDFKGLIRATLNKVDPDLSSSLGENWNVMGKLLVDLSTDFAKVKVPTITEQLEYYERLEVPEPWAWTNRKP